MLKEINGFPGYSVSDSGVIYNMIDKTLQKKYVGRHGHVTVALNNGTYWKTCAVSRLVAEAFVPNPNNYPYVAYKDGNKENLCAQNLYWVEKKNYNCARLKAQDIASGAIFYFDSITEAVHHIQDTKRAIYAGKLCKSVTIRKNIANALKQPDLYPYMYGYVWREDDGRQA